MADGAPLPLRGGCCPAAGALDAARLDARDPLERFARDLGGSRRRIELMTPDARCAACIGTIERGLGGYPGVERVRVNLSQRRTAVTYDPALIDPLKIVRALDALGYVARPFDAEAMRGLDRDAEGRDLLARLAVAGFAAMNVMLLSISVWSGAEAATRDFLHWISALIALPAIAFAGVPFYRSALRALRAGRLNMDAPISVAVWLAGGVSVWETAHGGDHAYFDASVSLVFFLLLGRYLDHRTRRAARSAAAELAGLAARSAVVIRPDGARETTPIEDIRPGDQVEIAAGERIPADGVVLSGVSDIDLSMLTGESAPEAASPGVALVAGAVNLSAPLVMDVHAVGDRTTLAEIARMVDAAERAETRHTRIADQAARIYAPVVHLAGLAALLWWGFAGGDWREAVLIAASVLIITCPCALGLAVPAVQASVGWRLFREAIFMKDGGALERLAKVDTVVFDKTGTLTTGEAKVISGPEAPALWAVAAALAEVSRHPYSRAVAAEAASRGVAPALATDLRETPGGGVSGRIEGRLARLGRADWAGAGARGARSEVWLTIDGGPEARFELEDPLRPDAAETVAALKALGLEVRLLSGDAPAAVARAAEGAGITQWIAGVDPGGKHAELAALAAEGRSVAMIGDGINDAPALAAADVSLAPAAAADVAAAAAHFVYPSARLSATVTAVRMARLARRRALQNFALAALYNVVAVPAAAVGLATPLVAALAMSGSSILVTLNAMRKG